MPDLPISGLPLAATPLPDDVFLPGAVMRGPSYVTERFRPRALNTPQIHPGFREGRNYVVTPAGQWGAGVIWSAPDVLELQPFICPSDRVPWQGIVLRLSAGGGAGSEMKLGLWEHDVAAGEPRGLPVAVSAAVATTGAGDILFPFTSALAAPKFGMCYWLGPLASAATPLPTVHRFPNTLLTTAFLLGASIGNSAAGQLRGLTINCPFATNLATLNLTGGMTMAATLPTAACIRT